MLSTQHALSMFLFEPNLLPKAGLHHLWVGPEHAHQTCALGRLKRRAVFVALVILLPVLEGATADPGDIGGQQRQQAEGWLQLKQDQKTYRATMEPLAPREATSLDQLEQRQQSDAGALGRRQRQSLNTDRNRLRGTEVELPALPQIELESRRELDRQRLDMRIQRETLRPGLR